MESVVRVYLAAADAYALYVDENLMLFEVFSLGGCHFFKLDVLWGY